MMAWQWCAQRRWWQHGARLLPSPSFVVEEVIVAGWPWSTRIAAPGPCDRRAARRHAVRERVHAVHADALGEDH
jgi:hypothetical protein